MDTQNDLVLDKVKKVKETVTEINRCFKFVKFAKEEMEKYKKMNEESNSKVLSLQVELQEKDAQLIQAQVNMTNLASEVNNFKTKDKSFETLTSQLNHKISEYKEKLDEYREVEDQNKKLLKENSKLKNEKNSLGTEIYELKNRIKENVTNQVEPMQLTDLQKQKEELYSTNLKLSSENSELIRRLQKADEELKNFQQKLANIDSDYFTLEDMVSKAFATDKNTLITKSDKNKYKLKAKNLKVKLANANTKLAQKNEKLKSAKKKIEQFMTFLNQSALSPSMTTVNVPPSYCEITNISAPSTFIATTAVNHIAPHTSITPHDSPIHNPESTTNEQNQTSQLAETPYDIDSIFNEQNNLDSQHVDKNLSNKDNTPNNAPKPNNNSNVNVLTQSEFQALTQSIMDELLSDDEIDEESLSLTTDSTTTKRQLENPTSPSNQPRPNKVSRSKDPVGVRIQQMRSNALKNSQAQSSSLSSVAPGSNSVHLYYPRFNLDTNLKRLMHKLPNTRGLTSLYVKNCEPLIQDIPSLLASIVKLVKQSIVGQLEMGEPTFEQIDEVWVNSVHRVPLSTDLHDLEYRFIISLVLFDTQFSKYNVVESLMDHLPRYILDPVESLKQPVSYISTLCRIFVSLCKITEDITRCRVFFYDVLTLFVDCPFHLEILSMIANIYPEIVTYFETNSKHTDVFLNVIESVVSGIFIADSNADDELYQIFIDKCGWSLLHQSPTLFDSIEKLAEFQSSLGSEDKNLKFLIEKSYTISRIFGSDQLKF